MRIAFVCPGFEPDTGVADYTRRLASECVRLGHQAAVLSLNDQFVDELRRFELPTGTPSGESTPVLRVPQKLGWREQAASASAFLDAAAPDWVSLQFVCYGFQRRGIVFPAIAPISAILAGRKVQLMFHETWIGGLNVDSLKSRFLGLLQRAAVRALVQRIQPQICHTHSQYYVEQLSRIGVAAERLPLFGSIPFAPQSADSWLYELLAREGIPINEANRDAYLLAGVFGSLSVKEQCRPEHLLQTLGSIAERGSRRAVLLLFGRHEADASAVWKPAFSEARAAVRTVDLGPQPAEKVSELFNSLDIGVLTTALQKYQKSSSAAAMLEHGLPMLAANEEPQFRGSSVYLERTEQCLFTSAEAETMPINELLRRRLPASRLHKIAGQFLESLRDRQRHLSEG